MNFRIFTIALRRWASCLALLIGAVLIFGTAVEARAQDDDRRVIIGVRQFTGNTTVIAKLTDGGPAAKAGLKVGDELLSIDEDYVIQPDDTLILLSDKKAGDQVRLEVKRGSEFLFFEVTLARFVKPEERGGDGRRGARELSKPGMVGETAPELKVERWSGLSPDQVMKLSAMEDKIVCMLLFQTDCQFSRNIGLPQVKKIHGSFEQDEDIIVLAIQTPFRNFDDNTLPAAVRFFEELGLDVPLGHDGSEQKRTVTYDEYHADGTPWFVVIDPQGVVRYNDNDLPLDEAHKLFDKLRKEVAAQKDSNESKTGEESTSDASNH